MPKLKTHKGAAKRFRSTASGKFKRGHSHARHILTKKTNKRKRNLDIDALVSEGDQKRVEKNFEYATLVSDVDEKREDRIILSRQILFTLFVNLHLRQVHTDNGQRRGEESDEREASHRAQLRNAKRQQTREDRECIDHQHSRAFRKPKRDKPMRCVIAAALRGFSSPQLSDHCDESRIEDRDQQDQDRNSEDREYPTRTSA